MSRPLVILSASLLGLVGSVSPALAQPAAAAAPAPAPAPEVSPAAEVAPAAEAAPAPTPEVAPAPAPAPAPPAKAAPTEANAPPPRHVLEVTASLAPTVFFGEPGRPDLQESFSRVGFGGGLTLGYRPRYFVTPFFGLAYADLARGQAQATTGETIGQSLGAWTTSGGLHLDYQRVRLRLGIGLSFAQMTNSSGGESHATSQFALSADLGLSYAWIQLPRFASSVEARYVEAAGIDLQYLSLGLSVRWDFWVHP